MNPIHRPKTAEEKSTKTTVDTILFSRAEAEAWCVPSFQRPVKVNAKVQELALQIAADGGVLPGVLTFGVCNKERYLLDGQQRRQAFLLSEKAEGYADVRTCFCDTPAAMAAEFVRLNSSLVRMAPDDILRGMEPSFPALQRIRDACPFVGYDSVRRNDQSPLLSMSATVRCWASAMCEVPWCALSAAKVVQGLGADDTQDLIRILTITHSAWGRDPAYLRLYNGVNLTLCMWLFRRVVLTTYSARTQRFDDDLFRKCCMSLSADPVFLDWLQGRRLGEHDRAPAYGRIKAIFTLRYQQETGRHPNLPAPEWSHGSRR